MLVSDFDYELPEELIAQRPPEVRGTSRMMTLDRRTGAFADRRFAELPSLLRAGDLLVLNDSRVIPARLYARRGGLATQEKSPAPSGLVEVLLTEKLGGENEWEALVKPAKKVPVGETLVFACGIGRGGAAGCGGGGWGVWGADAEVRGGGGFSCGAGADWASAAAAVYSSSKGCAGSGGGSGAVSDGVFAAAWECGGAGVFGGAYGGAALYGGDSGGVGGRGVEIARLTLHVGLGTFQPVRAERTEDIRLHAESYTISAETAEAVNRGAERGAADCCGGDDDDADAGACGAARRRDLAGRYERALGEHEFVSVARGGVQGGGWVADEFSSAGVDAADAGVGVCGTGECAGGLCTCG